MMYCGDHEKHGEKGGIYGWFGMNLIKRSMGYYVRVY